MGTSRPNGREQAKERPKPDYQPYRPCKSTDPMKILMLIEKASMMTKIKKIIGRLV
jgi:hypothetical protein